MFQEVLSDCTVLNTLLLHVLAFGRCWRWAALKSQAITQCCSCVDLKRCFWVLAKEGIEIRKRDIREREHIAQRALKVGPAQKGGGLQQASRSPQQWAWSRWPPEVSSKLNPSLFLHQSFAKSSKPALELADIVSHQKPKLMCRSSSQSLCLLKVSRGALCVGWAWQEPTEEGLCNTHSHIYPTELVTSCSLIWIRFQHATSAYLSKGVFKSQLRYTDFTGRHKAVAFGFVLANSVSRIYSHFLHSLWLVSYREGQALSGQHPMLAAQPVLLPLPWL